MYDITSIRLLRRVKCLASSAESLRTSVKNWIGILLLLLTSLIILEWEKRAIKSQPKSIANNSIFANACKILIRDSTDPPLPLLVALEGSTCVKESWRGGTSGGDDLPIFLIFPVLNNVSALFVYATLNYCKLLVMIDMKIFTIHLTLIQDQVSLVWV